jgi:hypothetical protein
MGGGGGLGTDAVVFLCDELTGAGYGRGKGRRHRAEAQGMGKGTGTGPTKPAQVTRMRGVVVAALWTLGTLE